MSERQPEERCSICDALTGKAGAGDGSIYWLDGAIGPLCEECSHTLRDEVIEDEGLADQAATMDTRMLNLATLAGDGPEVSREAFKAAATAELERLYALQFAVGKCRASDVSPSVYRAFINTEGYRQSELVRQAGMIELLQDELREALADKANEPKGQDDE